MKKSIKLTSIILSALIAASALSFSGCTGKNDGKDASIVSDVSSVAVTSDESSGVESKSAESNIDSSADESNTEQISNENVPNAKKIITLDESYRFINTYAENDETYCANYIIKDNRELYTIENGELKKLDKELEIHNVDETVKFKKYNDFSLIDENKEYRIAYEWYELDGKLKINPVDVASDVTGAGAGFTAEKDDYALLSFVRQSSGDYYMCNIKTGEITAPFAQAYEEHPINKVILSDDGKKAILSGREPAVYYFDGTDTYNLTQLCKLSAEDEAKYDSAEAVFAGNKVVIKFYLADELQEGEAQRRFLPDIMLSDVYVYDTETGEVSKTAENIKGVHLHGRYGRYTLDGKLYTIDFITGKSLNTEIEADSITTVYAVDDEHILACLNGGNEKNLIELSTGKTVNRAKVPGYGGTLITSTNGKKYISVYNGTNKEIYEFNEA